MQRLHLRSASTATLSRSSRWDCSWPVKMNHSSFRIWCVSLALRKLCTQSLNMGESMWWQECSTWFAKISVQQLYSQYYNSRCNWPSMRQIINQFAVTLNYANAIVDSSISLFLTTSSNFRLALSWIQLISSFYHNQLLFIKFQSINWTFANVETHIWDGYHFC